MTIEFLKELKYSNISPKIRRQLIFRPVVPVLVFVPGSMYFFVNSKIHVRTPVGIPIPVLLPVPLLVFVQDTRFNGFFVVQYDKVSYVPV